MLDRNRRIKKCPEKFQHCTEQFDLIITAEERVYDQVRYHFNQLFEIQSILSIWHFVSFENNKFKIYYHRQGRWVHGIETADR